MSFKELAPISNRLSCTSTRLPGSAASTMTRRLSSIWFCEEDWVRVAQPQGRQLLQLRVEFAGDVTFFQQVALDLCRSWFRDTLDGHDLRHFQSDLLIDQAADFVAMGRKSSTLPRWRTNTPVALSVRRVAARRQHYFAELQARDPLRNGLRDRCG